METIETVLEERLTALGSVFQPTRVFFVILFLLGVSGIILLNTGVFPITLSHALFYLLLLILFGLYRPSLLWQGLVFFLSFEILSVVSIVEGLEIRAYQFGLVALAVATAILWFQGKVTPPVLRWFDGALLLLLLGAIATFFVRSLPMANGKDLIILASFAVLYALGRIYLQKKSEVQTFLATLLVSGSVVAGYAVYQAIALQNQWSHFMVMTGRPNSVLEEADWLGFFLGMVAIIALILFLRLKRWYQEVGVALLLLLFLVTLILTVSRSAWLGFGIGVLGMVLLLGGEYVLGFINARTQDIRTLLKLFLGFPLLLVLALTLVIFFSLTPFALQDRFASTGTGDQVITVACTEGAVPPHTVATVEELPSYGCQHINLEERARFEQQGYFITEVERPDPNIAIRKSLYQDTWGILQKHFFFGLGWGESVKVFGTDGRGAGLNSSNLFLEVWLGSGLIGLIGILAFWLGIFWALVRRLIHKREMTEGFWLSVLVLALWLQVTVFNFFNAGLLSGTCMAFVLLAAWYGEKTVPYSLKSLWRK